MAEQSLEIPEYQKIAVSHYRKWKSENPDATEEEKFQMFDFLCDTAALNEMVNE